MVDTPPPTAQGSLLVPLWGVVPIDKKKSLKGKVLVAQACLTLFDPMECSQAPLSVGILQQEY